MKISRFIKVCMAVCLSIALVACSSSSSSRSVSIPDTKDIQKIQDRGVLRVGVKKSVPGFSEKKDGKYQGLEVDLAKKLADDLGVKVQYTSVTTTSRETLLKSGKIDCVIATYTITKERKKEFDFSTPYYISHVSVLVDDDNIKTLSDLNGRTIGVVTNSNSAKDLVKAMIDQGLINGTGFDEDNFDPTTWTTGVSFHVYNDYTQCDAALTAGDIDGMSTDTSILKGYTTGSCHLIDAEFAPQKYGIATKKDSGLSEFVNNEVKQWKKDGSIKALEKSYDL